MKSDDRIRLLAACPLFSGVDPERIGALADHELTRIVPFAAGEIIYDPAHYRRSLGIVLSGAARVYKQGGDGHRVVLNILEPGHLFGVATLFSEFTEYVSTIEAIRESRILFLPQSVVEEGFSKDPRLVVNYIAYLSDRIHFLNRKIDGFTGSNARNRLLVFLLDRVEVENGRGVVTPGTSLTQLAPMLNLSRASLYRALEQLEGEGLIVRRGKTIAIPDMAALIRDSDR